MLYMATESMIWVQGYHAKLICDCVAVDMMLTPPLGKGRLERMNA